MLSQAAKGAAQGNVEGATAGDLHKRCSQSGEQCFVRTTMATSPRESAFQRAMNEDPATGGAGHGKGMSPGDIYAL